MKDTEEVFLKRLDSGWVPAGARIMPIGISIRRGLLGRSLRSLYKVRFLDISPKCLCRCSRVLVMMEESWVEGSRST
jgi:hypothetical protein